MSVGTDRPRTHGGTLPWEQTERRAERATQSLVAVFQLLEAGEDKEAERLLVLIADRIKEEA